ncbi:MAG: biotin--[acetyl-CoA-carboxylase] ligase [Chitinophagaceae bacterium]|nr:biotin--[acetyl-CoA-carboxylase] ligase [Chitinophagaceae bacterium]
MHKSSPIGDVIIELTEIDSTNNYAMRLLNEGMAEHGLVIRADFQTAGRGQQGNTWLSEESKNLLFSIVMDTVRLPVESQFMLNAMTTVSIANLLMTEYHIPDIKIKWPNDVYAGKKKVSGILIENQLRGSTWSNAIIGIGINVNQSNFPDLLRASSILNETGKQQKLKQVLKKFLAIYNENFLTLQTDYHVHFNLYNGLLFNKGQEITFMRNFEMYKGKVIMVNDRGELQLEVNGRIKSFKHKEIEILLS